MSDVQIANPTPPFRPAGVGATGATSTIATGPTGATGTQAEHDARVAAHAAERQKVIAAETAAKAKIAAERKAAGFSPAFMDALAACLNYLAAGGRGPGQTWNALTAELHGYAPTPPPTAHQVAEEGHEVRQAPVEEAGENGEPIRQRR